MPLDVFVFLLFGVLESYLGEFKNLRFDTSVSFSLIPRYNFYLKVRRPSKVERSLTFGPFCCCCLTVSTLKSKASTSGLFHQHIISSLESVENFLSCLRSQWYRIINTTSQKFVFSGLYVYLSFLTRYSLFFPPWLCLSIVHPGSIIIYK